MNKSGLLHRATPIKEYPPIVDKAEQRREIAEHVAAWEAEHGAVETIPILSRAPATFAYTNLKTKNKMIAENQNES